MAALALAGCHARKRPPVFAVSRIAVSEATIEGNPSLDLSATDFKDRLVAALDRSGRFAPLSPEAAPQKKKTPSWRCHAEVSYTRESDEAADGGAVLRRADVGVAIDLLPTGSEQDALRAEASATRLFDAAAGSQGPGSARTAARVRAFRGALDSAIGDALARLLLDLDAVHESDTELIASLGSADAGVRDSAVRQLADRHNPAAVPALIERLKDSDRQVVLRAMGALEALHDPRAVQPLIDLTEHQDPSFVAQVVYVIGSLGGDEAEAYLFTLQNGSPDAQVRAAAAEAAADLRRRKQTHAAAR